MDIEKDIDFYIEAYVEPSRLGEHILNLITKELYLADPDGYAKKFWTLYKNTGTKKNLDLTFKMSILHKWLELSEFQDTNALAILKTTTISMLLLNQVSQDLMYKTISTWLSLSNTNHTYIARCLSTISDIITNESKYIDDLNAFITENTTCITEVYKLDNTQQVKLINNYITPNSGILEDKSLHINKHLNIIINNLNIHTVPKSEAVRLLALAQYLPKPFIKNLSMYCFPDNFKKMLTIAETLGVTENPDYWIQALNPIIVSDNTTLPEFNLIY